MARLDEFVADVRRSGLVSKATLDELRQSLPPGPPEQAHLRLARLLIERELLTTYQLNKLLAGATRGFFIGPYRILRKLGQGGLGKVYLAVHEPTGERVALKVLPPRTALEDQGAVERFQREVHLSQRVSHPHIARTIDVGCQDGVHYMALEYVPGSTLYQVVRSRHGGPLPAPEAARFFLGALEGLKAAHQAGLVHRDIKPSNLMVTPEGEAKVLDLGLAHALGEDRHPSGSEDQVVGTLDYASPEQLDDPDSVDPRSDLYSLGCSLYFALTGSPPFEGGDAINKLYKHRMEEPAPVERRAPGLPPEFGAIVRRLMAKDPAARYPDVAAVQAELKRWADRPSTGSRRLQPLKVFDEAQEEPPAPRDRSASSSQIPAPRRSGSTIAMAQAPAPEPAVPAPPPDWWGDDVQTSERAEPVASSIPSTHSRSQGARGPEWLRPVLIATVVMVAIAWVILSFLR